MSAMPESLPMFLPDIVGWEGQGGPAHLIGSRCESCDRWSFPQAEFCPRCLAPAQHRSLGGRGVIYSFTVVHMKPPFGLPGPYPLLVVDLRDAPLRVLMLGDAAQLDRLRIGLEVELRVAELGLDLRGRPCRRPFFSASLNT